MSLIQTALIEHTATIGYCWDFSERIGDDYEITSNKSLGSVVNNVLKLKNSKVQVIYFGELHKLNLQDYRIELERFTEEALPALKANNVNDVIVEFIPDDPEVEVELRLFYETGEISRETAPKLFSTINQFIYCAIIEFLKKTKELGIRVHAGGLSLAEAQETILQPDFLDDADLQIKAGDYIKGHTQKKIEELKITGKKIAIYGGMLHNDIKCTPYPATNLGAYLKNEFGNKYVEIDLLVPETLQENDKLDQIYAAPKGWKKLIPKKGVMTLRKGNSFIVIFPRTKDVKILDTSDDFLKCQPAAF